MERWISIAARDTAEVQNDRTEMLTGKEVQRNMK